MKMNGRAYDILKFIVWLYVPIMTLFMTILNIWLPESSYIGPIRDTLIAVEVFLGALVSKSNYDYNKGVDKDDTN